MILGMEWVAPKYSKGQVDRAGKFLLTDPHGAADIYKWYEEYNSATQIINNWRSSHSYPLNTFNVTLRDYSSQFDDNYLVAQRIKRLTSITHKLQRFSTLRLSQMQDIGGCRAIVTGINEVNNLLKKYEKSNIKHLRSAVDNYILTPKKSGYRGVHLIYKYNSDKKIPSAYNGLYVEIQIRSRLQHAWATAVETVGTFISQSLKSSQGEEKWLRFFAIMGSVIALKEGCALVPNTPDTRDGLIKELRQITGNLDVMGNLQMFGAALNVGQQATTKGDHYFLLKLEPSQQRMSITGFSRKKLEEANQRYLEIEKEIADVSGADVVLVSVDSINSLRRAYPNYFLDTQVFLDELREAVTR